MNESKINCHCPSEAKLKFCFLIGKIIRSTKVACVDGYAFKILHNLGFHQFRYTSWPPNLHSEAIISECCIALRDLLKIARMRYRREKNSTKIRTSVLLGICSTAVLETIPGSVRLKICRQPAGLQEVKTCYRLLSTVMSKF